MKAILAYYSVMGHDRKISHNMSLLDWQPTKKDFDELKNHLPTCRPAGTLDRADMEDYGSIEVDIPEGAKNWVCACVAWVDHSEQEGYLSADRYFGVIEKADEDSKRSFANNAIKFLGRDHDANFTFMSVQVPQNREERIEKRAIHLLDKSVDMHSANIWAKIKDDVVPDLLRSEVFSKTPRNAQDEAAMDTVLAQAIGRAIKRLVYLPDNIQATMERLRIFLDDTHRQDELVDAVSSKKRLQALCKEFGLEDPYAKP